MKKIIAVVALASAFAVACSVDKPANHSNVNNSTNVRQDNKNVNANVNSNVNANVNKNANVAKEAVGKG